MSRFVSNVLAVAYKEARVLRHDRAVMSSIAAQPVVMFLLFGWAISNTPRNVPWLALVALLAAGGVIAGRALRRRA